MKVHGLIVAAIAAVLGVGAVLVHADPKNDQGYDNSGRSDKDKERGPDKHDTRDRHDQGLHLGHYKNGKADAPATPAQPAPATTTVVVVKPATAQPAPAAPSPWESRWESRQEARRLHQIVRELRDAARERDAALDEAYTVASKENRPKKFEDRRDKILARYEALLLGLLGREDVLARLADDEPQRWGHVRPAPVVQKPAPGKGSSIKEIEAARQVVDLRAKLRDLDAEIADEKDDSAERLEHLLAARKRFEFRRDWEEVKRIDAQISVERVESEKVVRSLERKRSATAMALTRAQKELAEIRRESDDDDTARRRLADMDRRSSDRRRLATAD